MQLWLLLKALCEKMLEIFRAGTRLAGRTHKRKHVTMKLCNSKCFPTTGNCIDKSKHNSVANPAHWEDLFDGGMRCHGMQVPPLYKDWKVLLFGTTNVLRELKRGALVKVSHCTSAAGWVPSCW